MIGSKFFWLVSVSQLGILAQVFFLNNFWLLKIENYLSDPNIFSNYFKYHTCERNLGLCFQFSERFSEGIRPDEARISSELNFRSKQWLLNGTSYSCHFVKSCSPVPIL
ncbi:unnamed protein product, partial [Vitis vinifera]